MSLNYDLRAINPDDRAKYPDPSPVTMNGVTQTIIWATMAVGIGSITDKTAEEFYARVHVVERLNGPFLLNPEDGSEHYLTPEDIRAHIGLKTNVFPMEPRAKWRTSVMNRALGDHIRTYRRHVESLTPATTCTGQCSHH
jgi:hypothetical protein